MIDASFTELPKKTYLNLETGSGKSLGLAASPDAMELTSGLPFLAKFWPFMDAVVAVRAAEEDPTIFTQARIFADFHLFLFRCSLCSRVFCVQAEVGLRSFQLWLKPETFTEEGVKDGIIKGAWMNWVIHRFYRFTRDIGNTGHHFAFHLAERLEENALLPAVRRSSTR